MTRWLVILLAGGAAVAVVVSAVVFGVQASADAVAGDPDDDPWMALADADDMLAQADPSQAQAQAGPSRRGGPRDFLRRAREVLNLTDEQVARLERALLAHQDRTAPLWINLARARLDLREALLPATPDRARVTEIARRIADLQGQLTVARVELLLEIRSILTPEQYQRLRLLRPGPGAPRWRR